MICLIVAAGENGVIGDSGRIPWRIPGEQAYFKRVTMGHSVVMGRKTYESIGKPLPGRPNYVLTRDGEFIAPGVQVLHEIREIAVLAEREDVFVIGGAAVYESCLPFADKVYLTRVHQAFPGDAYFPGLDVAEWEIISSVAGPSDVVPHTFEIYERRTSRGTEEFPQA